MLIDTHIHLDRFPPETDLDFELEEARAAGIERFVVPGVDRDDWPRLQQVVAGTRGGLAAFGMHPQSSVNWTQGCADALRGFLRDGRAVAIGEIGLDRYADVPVRQQEQAFRDQLQIAVELSLPVLIHCRKMPGRVLEILEEERIGRVGGIMHAFSGSLESAKKAVDLGLYLSFGGSLTYPEARRSVEVLKNIPDDVVVIETDAPDLPPHPHRNGINRPVWLTLVLGRVAEIRGWTREAAAAITTANAKRILQLDSEK